MFLAHAHHPTPICEQSSVSNEEDEKAPKSIVINRTPLGPNGHKLMQDVRVIMEPYTTTKLRVRSPCPLATMLKSKEASQPSSHDIPFSPHPPARSLSHSLPLLLFFKLFSSCRQGRTTCSRTMSTSPAPLESPT